MAQILIRGLSEEDIARLREHARNHDRSLEAEARTALREFAKRPTRKDRESFLKFAAEMRKSLAGRIEGDSAEMIREAREERGNW